MFNEERVFNKVSEWFKDEPPVEACRGLARAVDVINDSLLKKQREIFFDFANRMSVEADGTVLEPGNYTLLLARTDGSNVRRVGGRMTLRQLGDTIEAIDTVIADLGADTDHSPAPKPESLKPAVDNFRQISEMLSFPNKDSFYLLQVIVRGKDHKDSPAANRIVKTYYLSHPDSLGKYRDEIVKLCEVFGARAYISLNRKDMRKCTCDTVAEMANRLSNGDVKKVYRTFPSCAGKQSAPKGEATWIVDIDYPVITEDKEAEIRRTISELWVEGNSIGDNRPDPEGWFVAEIPTFNGKHLITRPFRLDKFLQRFGPIVDVHKNHPTLLYMPDFSSSKVSRDNDEKVYGEKATEVQAE